MQIERIASNRMSSFNNDGSKLWDNEELVLTALKVYGKHPRPQCFNEISRVCKLSNLRKSRYFHEKMMKNNPYEKKILKLLAEEGEETYPFFKIFFEEYKTKKERQKLMNYEEDKQQIMAINNNQNHEYSNGYLENSTEMNSIEHNSIEHNGNEHNSNEDYYEAMSKNERYDDYSLSYVEYNENNANDGGQIEMQTLEDSELNINNHIPPLIESNILYLENLELKLKILNKEKETMSDYFETFSTVISNLQKEIITVKARTDMSEATNESVLEKMVPIDLKECNLSQLNESINEMKNNFQKLFKSLNEFESDQASLKSDLKVTKNYAHVENKKLHDELNECKAKLSIKDEQINDLQSRLEESLYENRVSSSKYHLVKSTANYSKSKMNELKENVDKLFTQIQSLK